MSADDPTDPARDPSTSPEAIARAREATAPADAGAAPSAEPNGAGPDPDDPMGPPKEPCECWCMHCRRTFMSTGVWFQRVVGAPPGELQGYWMCPTPNCDGAGFTFDIFPTDPDHPANEGWSWSDDDDEEEEGGEFDDARFDEGNDDEAQSFDAHADDDDGVDDWDPGESKWKELDGFFGGDGYADVDEDDFEGEEWKHGLQPGERPPEPQWVQDARLEREEEERQYDEPDRRPREIEWTDRGDPDRDGNGAGPRPNGGEVREDDIPF
jgi:hypothetical protein